MSHHGRPCALFRMLHPIANGFSTPVNILKKNMHRVASDLWTQIVLHSLSLLWSCFPSIQSDLWSGRFLNISVAIPS